MCWSSTTRTHRLPIKMTLFEGMTTQPLLPRLTSAQIPSCGMLQIICACYHPTLCKSYCIISAREELCRRVEFCVQEAHDQAPGYAMSIAFQKS
jgi:hypothetical protein